MVDEEEIASRRATAYQQAVISARQPTQMQLRSLPSPLQQMVIRRAIASQPQIQQIDPFAEAMQEIKRMQGGAQARIKRKLEALEKIEARIDEYSKKGKDLSFLKENLRKTENDIRILEAELRGYEEALEKGYTASSARDLADYYANKAEAKIQRKSAIEEQIKQGAIPVYGEKGSYAEDIKIGAIPAANLPASLRDRPKLYITDITSYNAAQDISYREAMAPQKTATYNVTIPAEALVTAMVRDTPYATYFQQRYQPQYSPQKELEGFIDRQTGKLISINFNPPYTGKGNTIQLEGIPEDIFNQFYPKPGEEEKAYAEWARVSIPVPEYQKVTGGEAQYVNVLGMPYKVNPIFTLSEYEREYSPDTPRGQVESIFGGLGKIAAEVYYDPFKHIAKPAAQSIWLGAETVWTGAKTVYKGAEITKDLLYPKEIIEKAAPISKIVSETTGKLVEEKIKEAQQLYKVGKFLGESVVTGGKVLYSEDMAKKVWTPLAESTILGQGLKSSLTGMQAATEVTAKGIEEFSKWWMSPSEGGGVPVRRFVSEMAKIPGTATASFFRGVGTRLDEKHVLEGKSPYVVIPGIGRTTVGKATSAGLELGAYFLPPTRLAMEVGYVGDVLGRSLISEPVKWYEYPIAGAMGFDIFRQAKGMAKAITGTREILSRETIKQLKTLSSETGLKYKDVKKLALLDRDKQAFWDQYFKIEAKINKMPDSKAKMRIFEQAFPTYIREVGGKYFSIPSEAKTAEMRLGHTLKEIKLRQHIDTRSEVAKALSHWAKIARQDTTEGRNVAKMLEEQGFVIGRTATGKPIYGVGALESIGIEKFVKTGRGLEVIPKEYYPEIGSIFRQIGISKEELPKFIKQAMSAELVFKTKGPISNLKVLELGGKTKFSKVLGHDYLVPGYKKVSFQNLSEANFPGYGKYDFKWYELARLSESPTKRFEIFLRWQPGAYGMKNMELGVRKGILGQGFVSQIYGAARGSEQTLKLGGGLPPIKGIYSQPLMKLKKTYVEIPIEMKTIKEEPLVITNKGKEVLNQMIKKREYSFDIYEVIPKGDQRVSTFGGIASMKHMPSPAEIERLKRMGVYVGTENIGDVIVTTKIGKNVNKLYQVAYSNQPVKSLFTSGYYKGIGGGKGFEFVPYKVKAGEIIPSEGDMPSFVPKKGYGAAGTYKPSTGDITMDIHLKGDLFSETLAHERAHKLVDSSLIEYTMSAEKRAKITSLGESLLRKKYGDIASSLYPGHKAFDEAMGISVGKAIQSIQQKMLVTSPLSLGGLKTGVKKLSSLDTAAKSLAVPSSSIIGVFGAVGASKQLREPTTQMFISSRQVEKVEEPFAISSQEVGQLPTLWQPQPSIAAQAQAQTVSKEFVSHPSSLVSSFRMAPQLKLGRSFVDYKFVYPPILPPEEKRRVIMMKLKKKKKQPKSYLVLTRKAKQVKVVSPFPLARGEALALGAKVARKTARASFQLVPTTAQPRTLGLRPVTETQLFISGEFRPPKIKGLYKGGDIFVQPSFRRMGTRPEIKDIQSFKPITKRQFVSKSKRTMPLASKVKYPSHSDIIKKGKAKRKEVTWL